ncbi:MAG: aminotransferase class V-fold PLP-dependent enzyme [Candidatus Lokiarchaeota archaeon]|nr:aminotransferase class V-fold PLP-dependent enzyme [Candidatus Lokiarchaeota archaeon]
MTPNKYIYLDNAATTPMDPRVIDVVQKHFRETYGNSSSLHRVGQKAAYKLETSRKTMAELLDADRLEIYYTSSGTEADNTAIIGTALANKSKGNHIITSSIEHHAVENPCKYLEQNGFEITYLPVDNEGLISLSDLEDAIRSETILVSIMFANNEIGTIQPIKEIGKILKEKGIIFHTDAVQAFGKIPIDVKEMNIDLLSASAHKIYGPKGIGLLYISNKGIRQDGSKYIQPILFGGGHERNMRPSTVAVPLIAGFEKAVELCRDEMIHEAERQIKMRDKIISFVLEEIDDCFLNGPSKKRLPNNTNFSFKYVDGESIVLDLDEANIATSTGSACSSQDLDPSHVLLAIGLSPRDAQGSLRASIGRFTTEVEVDYFLEKLSPIIKRLREISPIGSS